VPLALILILWVTASGQAASPDIVISQVYGGGGNAGATYTHDFIELYNRGSTPVDVTGWSVQYAAATSGSWSKTAITGTIEPGHYFLIQEASGGANGISLPTPNITGSIAMAATAGKVALVTDRTSLACGATADDCLPNATIRDFVGYGSTANNHEGATPTANLSATNAARRSGANNADTDENGTDFAVQTPSPHNSFTPTAVTLAHLAAAPAVSRWGNGIALVGMAGAVVAGFTWQRRRGA
jgi:predicted extracellular nuclease